MATAAVDFGCSNWADCSCTKCGAQCKCGSDCGCGSASVDEVKKVVEARCPCTNCKCGGDNCECGVRCACDKNSDCDCGKDCNCAMGAKSKEEWIAMTKRLKGKGEI